MWASCLPTWAHGWEWLADLGDTANSVQCNDQMIEDIASDEGLGPNQTWGADEEWRWQCGLNAAKEYRSVRE